MQRLTPDLTVRYNCLGFPYRACEVCGKKEVRVTRSGALHRSHLKGRPHRDALALALQTTIP